MLKYLVDKFQLHCTHLLNWRIYIYTTSEYEQNETNSKHIINENIENYNGHENKRNYKIGNTEKLRKFADEEEAEGETEKPQEPIGAQ